MLRTVPAWNNLGTPISFFITTFLLGYVVNAAGLIYYSESKSVVIINLMIVLLVGLQLAVNTMTLLYLSSKGGAALESIRILSVNFRTVFNWALVDGPFWDLFFVAGFVFLAPADSFLYCVCSGDIFGAIREVFVFRVLSP